MRANVSVLLLIALMTGACSGSDCLPEPEHDQSPPQTHVAIEFSPLAGGRQTSQHVPGDSTETIVADRQNPVAVSFAASDSSGLRSISPGITIQQTVGLGVERSNIAIDPVVARCPRHDLSYRHEIRATGMRRTLLITVVAENWVGLTAYSELLTIRLE